MLTLNVACQSTGAGCTLADLITSVEGADGFLACIDNFSPSTGVPLTVTGATCPGSGEEFNLVNGQTCNANKCLLPQGTVSDEDACNFGTRGDRSLLPLSLL